MFIFAFLLFPFVFAGAIYWLAFRFAGRSKSPRKSVTQFALLISAAVTFAFIAWSAISLASQGPTGKVLGMVFLNFFMLGIGLISFILAWPAVYAVAMLSGTSRGASRAKPPENPP